MNSLSRYFPKGPATRPLAITGALMLIVMSMVVPMPASVLDAGFALSIATAMLILVMASLVEKPTDFANGLRRGHAIRLVEHHPAMDAIFDFLAQPRHPGESRDPLCDLRIR